MNIFRRSQTQLRPQLPAASVQTCFPHTRPGKVPTSVAPRSLARRFRCEIVCRRGRAQRRRSEGVSFPEKPAFKAHQRRSAPGNGTGNPHASGVRGPRRLGEMSAVACSREAGGGAGRTRHLPARRTPGPSMFLGRRRLDFLTSPLWPHKRLLSCPCIRGMHPPAPSRRRPTVSHLSSAGGTWAAASCPAGPASPAARSPAGA